MKQTSILIALLCLNISLVGQTLPQSSNLAKYRTMALEYNHTLKAAEKNIAASIELEKMAKADMKPKLSGDANAGYIGNPMDIQTAGLNMEGTHWQYGVGLSVFQPIYSGGKILENIRIAKLQGTLSLYEAEKIKAAVCYQTDIQYWNTVAKQEMVIIAEAYYNSISSLVKTIKERVEVGAVDVQDLLMVEVKQNEAELQLLQAKNNLTTGLMAFNSIVGLDMKNATELDITIPEVLLDKQLMTLESKDMPEILKAQEEVKLAESILNMNDAKYRPQVYAGLNANCSAPAFNIGNNFYFNYGVQVKLTVPILEWGKRRREKNISKQNIGIATDNLNKTVDDVDLEIETTKVALDQTLSAVRLSGSSLDKAIENEEKAMERYQEGRNSILEVIDAQIYRMSSQMNYVQSKMNAQGYYSALLRVLNAYTYEK